MSEAEARATSTRRRRGRAEGEPGTLGKALEMLSPHERKTGLLMLGLLLAKGIGDTIGVAAVVPFLSIVGNPALIQSNAVAAEIYARLGFASEQSFIVAAGFAVIAVMFSTAFLRSVATHAINRWVSMREYVLSRRLLETYLRQPYAFFLNRHSGDLSVFILAEAGRVVGEAYRPAAEIVSAGMTFLFIAALLIWADPVVTLVSVGLFGGTYLAIYWATRSAANRLGRTVTATNVDRYRIAGEALHGIKQIKLLGREQAYLTAYAAPALEQARSRTRINTLRQLPRYGVEALAFGGIILLTLGLLSRMGGVGSAQFSDVVPLLGLYALAGYRLLPTFTTIYMSVASLRFGAAAVDAVYADLQARRDLEQLPRAAPAPLPLRRAVAFRNVSFRYPNARTMGIDSVSLEVPRGSTIGIVGATGAGKTTFVDLLLGLLRPTDGEILIDGVRLDEGNLRAWQANLGYVPQEIFLTDDSVSRNIAMGIPPEEIDERRVEAAARHARIHDFVVRELPAGYATKIGERGVRLSGGQRQRIGIARALYPDPDVVVFDEATSALDSATEREVMEEIGALSGAKTLFLIAHRLSTVQHCDRIVVLEQGRIVGQGSYAELAAGNLHFKRLARISHS